jgi:hypothetical protein
MYKQEMKRNKNEKEEPCFVRELKSYQASRFPLQLLLKKELRKNRRETYEKERDGNRGEYIKTQVCPLSSFLILWIEIICPNW